jgi:predicted neuraminidase
MQIPRLWGAALALAALEGLNAQTMEFVGDPLPTPSAHASTVVELKDGGIMAAWFGGTAEGRPDVAIWGARRTKDGWQKPVELVREHEIATFNPVLFHSKDGVLWLYYKFGPKPDNWTAGRRMSRDEGATWSEVEHLPAGIYGPIRAKPLVESDGTIISGTSVESYLSWSCWIERSTDNGRTWTRHGPITIKLDPQEEAKIQAAGTRHGIIQPVVVPMGGKHLRLYARSTPTVGRICVADSDDGGITWTPARATTLPNPNSGIDVVKLRDGRLVMIYNHTATGRSPLNLAVSKDGESWKMFHALESGPGEYSYPALIQGTDGDLHITYTWNRKNIRYVRWPLAKIP